MPVLNSSMHRRQPHRRKRQRRSATLWSRGVAIGAALSLSACSTQKVTSTRGVPCGNAQYATARAVLPDTGIDGGGQVLLVFIQHDPDISGELTELAVEHVWLAGSGVDPAADPRVRVVRDDARVLLDTIATRFDQPNGKFDLPTWFVLYWIRSSEVRTAFYEGFQNQSIWLELWGANATAPGTRVRLSTETEGVTPAAVCL